MWAAALPRHFSNGVDDSREVWNPTPPEIPGEVKTEQLLPGFATCRCPSITAGRRRRRPAVLIEIAQKRARHARVARRRRSVGGRVVAAVRASVGTAGSLRARRTKTRSRRERRPAPALLGWPPRLRVRAPQQDACRARAGLHPLLGAALGRHDPDHPDPAWAIRIQARASCSSKTSTGVVAGFGHETCWPRLS